MRYVATTAAVGPAAVATLLLRPWMGPSVSILFFPAIILSALYGGYGPSVPAALLSTMGLAFFIIPPYNSFDIGTGDVLRHLDAVLPGHPEIEHENIRVVLPHRVDRRRPVGTAGDDREISLPFKELL